MKDSALLHSREQESCLDICFILRLWADETMGRLSLALRRLDGHMTAQWREESKGIADFIWLHHAVHLCQVADRPQSCPSG
jgi:hypothetical protein